MQAGDTLQLRRPSRTLRLHGPGPGRSTTTHARDRDRPISRAAQEMCPGGAVPRKRGSAGVPALLPRRARHIRAECLPRHRARPSRAVPGTSGRPGRRQCGGTLAGGRRILSHHDRASASRQRAQLPRHHPNGGDRGRPPRMRSLARGDGGVHARLPCRARHAGARRLGGRLLRRSAKAFRT